MTSEISTDEVREKLDGDADVQVVDIRPPGEYEDGHIPGAVNIPMSDLPARIDEFDWGDDVVVACPVGQSSKQAAKLIGSYEEVDDPENVKSMAGGYDDWEYELETGRGEDGADADA